MTWKDLKEDPRPPVRPIEGGHGTKGRPIRLRTNFFPVHFKNPNIEFYQYDVVIKDQRGGTTLPKSKKMMVFNRMTQVHSQTFQKFPIAYDQEKCAYSVGCLPTKGKTFEVTLEEGRPETFTVILKVVGHAKLKELLQSLKYNPDNQTVIPANIFQMCEIMFRHNRAVRYEQVGRRCFFPIMPEFGQHTNIGGGKQGVVGFFSSLRPAQWKDGSVLLNINVANTAFYKEQPLLDFLKEVLNFRDDDFRRTVDENRRRMILKEVKGLKVRAIHTAIKRTYRIEDIVRNGAARQTFTLENETTGEKKEYTVQEYFKERYNVQLRYPHLNLLHCAPLKKSTYLPMELCIIAKGQKVKKKLTEREVATFIRSTAVQPSERFERICQISNKNDFSNDPLVKIMNADVSKEPLNIMGRVLPPINLKMKEKDFFPKSGVWDLRDKEFMTPATLHTWAVLNYDNRTHVGQIKQFVETLARLGREHGMSIALPEDIVNARSPNPRRDLEKLSHKIRDLQIVLVIVYKREGLYGLVKKAGDIELGLLTQCVQAINVSKCQPTTIVNILLKINAKLGGTNNIISRRSETLLLEKPVMIMGADVNHAPAGDVDTPSLAAVVASTNKHATQYAVEVRHQRSRKEVIEDLKNMTKSLLTTFRRRTDFIPERIIMYRDGVSESQFTEVLASELLAMRKACEELHSSFKPAMTFIVVQKRHHTRFFCSPQEGVGKCKNVPPGTVVDTDITHPYERDFYLCSHMGIQGTSKPSHYHVLWDDSDLTADELERLTYALCHVYSRCPRSVSIPAPAYYAHLAAFRAKVHLDDLTRSYEYDRDGGDGRASNLPSDKSVDQAIQTPQDSETQRKMYFL
ncbi:protein argonaute-3-like [Oratosquilla oratoria]|uniref:protein argonaute-3-like n=1 Tax=Oratosquilla oratoria TaxID=337810 RepID=UPI003F762D37